MILSLHICCFVSVFVSVSSLYWLALCLYVYMYMAACDRSNGFIRLEEVSLSKLSEDINTNGHEFELR